MGLDVIRARQGPEVRHHLVFIAGREQGGQEDDVRHARAERRDRGVPRVDDHEVGLDALPDDPREERGLLLVGFDREDQTLPAVFRHYVLTMKATSTAPTTAKTTSGAFSML